MDVSPMKMSINSLLFMVSQKLLRGIYLFVIYF